VLVVRWSMCTKSASGMTLSVTPIFQYDYLNSNMGVTARVIPEADFVHMLHLTTSACVLSGNDRVHMQVPEGCPELHLQSRLVRDEHIDVLHRLTQDVVTAGTPRDEAPGDSSGLEFPKDFIELVE